MEKIIFTIWVISLYLAPITDYVLKSKFAADRIADPRRVAETVAKTAAIFSIVCWTLILVLSEHNTLTFYLLYVLAIYSTIGQLRHEELKKIRNKYNDMLLGYNSSMRLNGKRSDRIEYGSIRVKSIYVFSPIHWFTPTRNCFDTAILDRLDAFEKSKR